MRCILQLSSLFIPAVGCVLAAVLAGCAASEPQRSVATAAAPTRDELPVRAEVQRTIPARVTAERDRSEPRRRTVPDFKVPELTAEEKRILGRDADQFQFLKYPDRRLRPGHPVGPWYAGPEIGVYGGTGGARVTLAWSDRVAAAGPEDGGARVAEARTTRVAGVMPPDGRTARVGPEAAIVQVGTDPKPCEVADHYPTQQND